MWCRNLSWLLSQEVSKSSGLQGRLKQINQAGILSLCKHMMETQSLMKSLFTHISMSAGGCNPSHYRLSLIPTYHTNLILSFPHLPPCLFPLPLSPPHSPWLHHPFNALPPPSSAFICSFTPLLLTLFSHRGSCVFNYSSLHLWRSECWVKGLTL